MMNAIRAAALFALFLGTVHAQSQSDNPAPIRLHPANPHYFLFQGKAVALISSGEHYGAVLNPDFDYHRYLATLAADGLNHTSLCRFLPGSASEILRNTEKRSGARTWAVPGSLGPKRCAWI